MSLQAVGNADMSGFSEDEMVVIDMVCNKMKKLTSRAATKMSHDEPVWNDHVSDSETIPFCEAFSLVGM